MTHFYQTRLLRARLLRDRRQLGRPGGREPQTGAHALGYSRRPRVVKQIAENNFDSARDSAIREIRRRIIRLIPAQMLFSRRGCGSLG